MGERLDVMKGTLGLLLLRAVEGGPHHGHHILKWIRSVTDETFFVEEGALYPALHRLEQRGYLEASWGRTSNNRRAKFYALTTAGRAHLEAETARWTRYVETMAKVLGAST